MELASLPAGLLAAKLAAAQRIVRLHRATRISAPSHNARVANGSCKVETSLLGQVCAAPKCQPSTSAGAQPSICINIRVQKLHNYYRKERTCASCALAECVFIVIVAIELWSDSVSARAYVT